MYDGKKTQADASVNWVHKLKYKINGTKYFNYKVFEYIYPLGETLAYIAWAIRSSYHHTIMATPGQAVFGINMLFKLV